MPLGNYVPVSPISFVAPLIHRKTIPGGALTQVVNSTYTSWRSPTGSTAAYHRFQTCRSCWGLVRRSAPPAVFMFTPIVQTKGPSYVSLDSKQAESKYKPAVEIYL